MEFLTQIVTEVEIFSDYQSCAFCRCKYLYLLFDDSFMLESNYVFTTEGHPLPVLSTWHEELPEAYIPTNWTNLKVFASTKLHSPHLHKTSELEKCLYIFFLRRDRDEPVQCLCKYVLL